MPIYRMTSLHCRLWSPFPQSATMTGLAMGKQCRNAPPSLLVRGWTLCVNLIRGHNNSESQMQGKSTRFDFPCSAGYRMTTDHRKLQHHNVIWWSFMAKYGGSEFASRSNIWVNEASPLLLCLLIIIAGINPLSCAVRFTIAMRKPLSNITNRSPLLHIKVQKSIRHSTHPD